MNALAWAPHSSCHICTAGDDSQALIWDLSSMSQPLDQGLGALPNPAANLLASRAGTVVPLSLGVLSFSQPSRRCVY